MHGIFDYVGLSAAIIGSGFNTKNPLYRKVRSVGQERMCEDTIRRTWDEWLDYENKYCRYDVTVTWIQSCALIDTAAIL